MFEDRRAVFCAASENESLSGIGIEISGFGWDHEWRVGAGLWQESASEGRAYRDVIPSRKVKMLPPCGVAFFKIWRATESKSKVLEDGNVPDLAVVKHSSRPYSAVVKEDIKLRFGVNSHGLPLQCC